MLWGILITLGILVLVVGSVVSGVVTLLFAPQREPSSPVQLVTLAGLGIVAFIVTVVLGTAAPDAWFVPGVLWLVALAIIRNRAPLRETDQQRREREAAEREWARAKERERADALGRDGLAFMQRATSAVDAVGATEAARDGWLGQTGDLDFRAELKTLSDTLLQARRIEKVMADSKALPDPAHDDVILQREAKKTVQTLRDEARRRVQALDDCAQQARAVDRVLAGERREQQLSAKRDETRARLAAELYGAEVRAATPIPDFADTVAAHVAAFHELKGTVDERVQREMTPAAAPDQRDVVRDTVSWVRGRLPF